MFDRLTVQDVQTKPVYVAQEEHEMTHALGIMDKRNVSCLLVVNNRRPIGFLTQRDVVQGVVRGLDVESSSVQDFMSQAVIIVESDTTLRNASPLLLERDARHLLVRDGSSNKVGGIVSVTDIVEAMMVEYFCELTPCKDVMTVDVLTAGPKDKLAPALTRMFERNVSSVVVVEDGKPIGIVTEKDVEALYLKGFSEKKRNKMQLRKVMSSPVITVQQTTQVCEAAIVAQKRNLRRLVVVDQYGTIVGIIAQHDVFTGLIRLKA